MNTLSLPAPAKINRMLHLVGRREDGYHLLQTLFQFVDLADRLDFRKRTDGHIQLQGAPDGLPQSQNLIDRAARLLQPLAGRQGVEIDLYKQLPMGAGLGGGSSNAATTLLALNRLWQLNLSLEQLAKMGLQLGADVPVFIRGQAAWAEGIGEQLTPVALPEQPCVLIAPGCHCSTATLFTLPQLPRATRRITAAQAMTQTGSNDFTTCVRQLYPPVAEALDWLAANATLSGLSGSGACVFALCTTQAEAARLVANCPKHFAGQPARCWLTHTRNLSAAHQALAE